MSSLNKIEAVIGGEIITLVSAENEEFMQKIARYIDRKLSEIKRMKSNASINERTRTLFIAINIAEDYFKTLETLHNLEEEHEKFVTELGRMQEENYLLTEKLHELQDRMNATQAEAQSKQQATAESNNVVTMKPHISGKRR